MLGSPTVRVPSVGREGVPFSGGERFLRARGPVECVKESVREFTRSKFYRRLIFSYRPILNFKFCTDTQEISQIFRRSLVARESVVYDC